MVDEGEFERLAEGYLKLIDNTLEFHPKLITEEISYSQGVLSIDMGKRGTWVLNKQTPNQQIWWSSPLSGPRRFFFVPNTNQWHWTRDHDVELTSSLFKELDI